MSALKILSIPEQIAVHLRGEISRGRWHGVMPGRNELAKQFGVGITSMQEALRQLEEEGLLLEQGAGRLRRIVGSTPGSLRRQLRIAILAYEKPTMTEGIFSDAAHLLREAGHDAFFSASTLVEMKMSESRVGRLVRKTAADAWVICSAPREITEWFAAQSTPAFALFGRRRGVRIASVGPDKAPACAAAVRRLIDFGHRKIVMLCRPDRRLPNPGPPERAILAELAAHGITPGSYNLPDWEDGVDGFQTCLESLFKVSPPTALIVDELLLFVATQQFLMQKRLRVPEDVSLVSVEAEPAFEWCRPSVAHIQWDRSPVMRRLGAWANHIARGKKDLIETLTPAEFIDGGTIGPVKRWSPKGS